MKKILFILIVTFCCGSVSASAQAVDEWNIFPIIDTEFEQVVETPDKVYYTMGSSLYSYDKSNDETYPYNRTNKLSSTEIKFIKYIPEKKCLAIIYTDSNIDMLYDDGHCVNMADIKDASVNYSKDINDIVYGNNYYVVSTAFGLVVYNADTHHVKESCIFGENISHGAVVGDYLTFYKSDALWYSPIENRHNTIDKFKSIPWSVNTEYIPLDDKRVIWYNDYARAVATTTFDFDAQTSVTDLVGSQISSHFGRCKDGIFFRDDNMMRIVGMDGILKESFEVAETYRNDKIGMWNGKSSLWCGTKEGIANIDMSSATPTVLSQPYRPEGTIVDRVAYLIPSPDGRRIYASNMGSTAYRISLAYPNDGIYIRQKTNIIENGKLRDVSIVNASATASTTQDAQRQANSTFMFGGAGRLSEYPEDSDIYFIANGQEGVYVVRGNEEIYKFNSENSPLLKTWNTRAYDVNFDPQGNLWVGYWGNNDLIPYIVLPADKLRKDFEQIKNSDWRYPNLPSLHKTGKDFRSLFCKKSNVAFFISSQGYTGVDVLKSKGDWAACDEHEEFYCPEFIDQDNNTIKPQYVFSMVEDQRGRVWIGTNAGLLEIVNPTTFDGRVNKLKVPRNDGTNYADYLLDSEQINAMAIDGSNRKWICTDASGIYLVSENGDRILKHFDVSNSPLPSNTVHSVICDPFSNVVYFGTGNGLLSYRSDSSPAAEDFSDVYAYPNPVRPDYTGWITVTGLMDNSLVKIADAAGNVFYQGKSEGGMITWDGCNAAGQRVRSGVYFVYASSDGGDSSGSTKGVVTKIVVVN